MKTPRPPAFRSSFWRVLLAAWIMIALVGGVGLAREGDITINAYSHADSPCDGCEAGKGRKICYEVTLAKGAENDFIRDFHVSVNSASKRLFQCFTAEYEAPDGKWLTEPQWEGGQASQIEGTTQRHYASWRSLNMETNLRKQATNESTMRFCMVYCGADGNLDDTAEFLFTNTGDFLPAAPDAFGNRADVPKVGGVDDPGWKGTKKSNGDKIGFLVALDSPFEVVNLGGNHHDTLIIGHAPGAFDLTGGGADAWDAWDNAAFAAQAVEGDFDVRVRVEDLDANSRWTKAGLMARESFSETSRMVFNRVTPPSVPTRDGEMGANDSRFAYRTGRDERETGGGRNGGRHEDGAGSPEYPNAWLRLRRVGDVITGYFGADGVNWIQQGSQDTASWSGGALPRRLFVGLAVSKGPSGAASATARFRDYQLQTDVAPSNLRVLTVSSEGHPQAVKVTFNRPVSRAADDLRHWFLDPGAITEARLAGNDREVWLRTAEPLTEGRTYSLRVEGVVGQEAREPLAAGSVTIRFLHGEGYKARRIAIQHFDHIPGPSVESILASQAYIRDLADSVSVNALFEDTSGETRDDFSGRIFGVLGITQTGDYRFFVSSDDQSRLFLSTDDQPANKIEIAREPEWNGARQYASTDRRGPNRVNRSAPVRLEAGKRYFIEQVFAEGFLGNNASVAWQPPGAPEPANGASPIPESAFVPARYVQGSIYYNLGPPRFLVEPASQLAGRGEWVGFGVRLDGTPPFQLQWQRLRGADFVDIPGATDVRYELSAAPSDNGAVFRCVAMNPSGAAVSAAVTLAIREPDCNGNGVPDSQDLAQGSSFDGNRNGIPDECEAIVTLRQASFVDAEGAVTHPHTDHALLSVRAVPPPDESVAWLNVRDGARWVVKNMPLLPHARDGRPSDYHVGYNLGNRSGAPVTDADLTYTITPRPLASPTPGIRARVTVAEHSLYPSAALRDPTDSLLPFRPLPARDYAFNADPDDVPATVTRRGVPTVDEMPSHCGPGAGARCLGWLDQQYGLGLGRTPQAIYDKLKDADHMAPNTKIGTYYDRIAPALQKCIDAAGLGGVLMAADCRDGSPSDLVEALKQGKDVIMLMGYHDEDGKRTGGHIVIATGATVTKDGEISIDFKDDNYGGDSQGDGKPDAGGTKTAKVSDNGNGEFDLHGFGGTARFEGFVKVCVDPIGLLRHFLDRFLDTQGIFPSLVRDPGEGPHGQAELERLNGAVKIQRDNAGFLLHTLRHEKAPPILVSEAGSLWEKARSLARLFDDYVRQADPGLIPSLRNLARDASDRAQRLLRCLTSPGLCEPGPMELRITRARDGTNLVLTWNGRGVLQTAATPAGPWIDMHSASSPTTIPPAGEEHYFRIQRVEGCRVFYHGVLSGNCPIEIKRGALICVAPCPASGCPTPPIDDRGRHYLKWVDGQGNEVCRLEVSPTMWCEDCPGSEAILQWVDPRDGSVRGR